MSVTKAQESVCIEMAPTNTVELEKNTQTNSLEGDMYTPIVFMISSRFDPKARARAANMTSYVAIIANVTLTVIKVLFNDYYPFVVSCWCFR